MSCTECAEGCAEGCAECADLMTAQEGDSAVG